ncbi:MAG: ATP-binding protein [Rubricella sp.]
MLKLRHRASLRRFETLIRTSQGRRFRAWATFALALIGPVLAVLTYLAFRNADLEGFSGTLRAVLMADFVYVLILAGLLARRVAAIIAARRAKSAGSRLHMRLTGVFSLMALGPTILVAVFATVTINLGLEGWFSERIRSVVANSLETAEAYESEHRLNLTADARLLANFINRNKEQFPLINDPELRELLANGQRQMQRELSEAFVIDGAGEIVVRGDLSYLFAFERPAADEISAARRGEIVIIPDREANEMRALIAMPAFADRYLYVTRAVDGEILDLLDDTRATVSLYRQLEGDRGRLLFEFALIYLAFALVVILAAIFVAFWFADRLARPVARLAGAAQRVGQGDFDVRVKEERGEDEIALLGRTFNRMTQQVTRQRDALVEARNESDRRRRTFEAVLSGVSAGVIGIDETGRIEVMNSAAADLLGRMAGPGEALGEAFPAFGPLFDRIEAEGRLTIQDQVRVSTPRRDEELLVRIGRHRTDDRHYGYVVTFDSITDLVSAQRMAAWGDVARRIAHEIKNPLTPIQLSAERMRRKYGPQIAEGREGFDQIADVIVRQTNDLRRIVDEFSRFARLPEPRLTEVDLRTLIEDALVLRDEEGGDVRFVADLPAEPVRARLDPGLIGQALSNLVKNAGEAVAEGGGGTGVVTIRIERGEGEIVVLVEDDGPGLPEGAADRLFEPYVTTRDKGTGLGLPIVRKIVEDHGGRLILENREGGGARARIHLPAFSTAPETTETGALHA